MLPTNKEKQDEMEFVSIGELVPPEHLLRKVENSIDFEFIREKVRGMYCADNGRPAIDPVVLFKMLFIGYLFGVRSERQLEREIQVNVAYRWFLGFGLRNRIPDASTLSQNRRRRFSESTVYQEIFDEIVLQAIKLNLVEGKILYTDSTHLKANANKNKFEEREVKRSTRKYLDELEEDINEDRQVHGKKVLKVKDKEEETKTSKISTVDPESGYMVRDGKPKGFFYLDHRTVDGKHAIITDSHATPANVHDSIPYLDRLDRQIGRFGFKVEAVGLDAGYFTPGICKGIEERNIYGVMGYRRPNHIKGYFYKRDYQYDVERDSYWCPCGQEIPYRTTNRNGYREYISDAKQCRKCECLGKCTRSANCQKVVTRHVWQVSKDHIDKHRLSKKGKAIYARRKETVERSFADAKQLHGHRYARMRGLEKVSEQCLLAAACQNIKKIALITARQLFLSPIRPIKDFFSRFHSILQILDVFVRPLNFFSSNNIFSTQTENPA
jgi:transposase